MSAVLLQVCPICLGGPVVQRGKTRLGGLLTKARFVCGVCGSVLEPFGDAYRYDTISSDYRHMKQHLRGVSWSLDQLTEVAYGRLKRAREEEQRQRYLAAQEQERQQRRAAEEEIRRRLQPRTLGEFVGQDKIKDGLALSIKAAKARGEALGHVLLCGPVGCGKRTLALVIAKEMGSSITITSGQAVGRPGDLAAIVTNLGERDMLFIDDIHRLPANLEERLCGAMQAFALDIVIGSGPSAKTAHLPLPRFTLIGATDRPKRVSGQLRRCFREVYEFEQYDDEALAELVRRRARARGIDIEDEACREIGRGARGVIREAGRLLDRARDYAQVRGEGAVTLEVARWAGSGAATTAHRQGAKPLGLTWQEFEVFVAKVFEALGYQNVRLTAPVTDEGRDIEMEWADPLRGTRKLYVECKYWKSASVGRRDVQVLHSAVMANPRVDEGVLVTTGSFTDGAIAYAEQVGVVQLIDRSKLRELIAKAGMEER